PGLNEIVLVMKARPTMTTTSTPTATASSFTPQPRRASRPFGAGAGGVSGSVFWSGTTTMVAGGLPHLSAATGPEDAASRPIVWENPRINQAGGAMNTSDPAITPTNPVREAPDRNLALELVRVTEAAAMAAGRWVGRGDKIGGDGAAVDAMRKLIGTVSMNGVVVIGEGEKDQAPMLYNGEQVGNGDGPYCDVAVDPIDGTTLMAKGMPNAIAVLAATERGAMFDPSAVFYMEKLAVGPESADVVDLTAPVAENIRRVARAKDSDGSGGP